MLSGVVLSKEASEMCIICQEGKEVGDEVTDFVTPCKHHYHKVCLDEWRKTKNICPLCGTNLPMDPLCGTNLPMDPFSKAAELASRCFQMLVFTSLWVILSSLKLTSKAVVVVPPAVLPAIVAASYRNESPFTANSICVVGSLLQVAAIASRNPDVAMKCPLFISTVIFMFNINLSRIISERFF